MTLRSANTLDAYAIRATDGEIGGVHDFLFDDQHWTVRYMVADTGGWLTGRRVLISPAALGTAEWQSMALNTRLTRRQVEHSPDIDSDQPVSRQHEFELASYYGYAPYWSGGGIWGPGMDPLGLWGAGALGAPLLGTEALKGTSGTATQRETAQEQRGDPHLHSMREVTGYSIQALDDDIGHVDDFVLDDENWVIRYLVVDTRNWWPGKRVLVSPRWITDVSWAERAVHVDLRKEQIKTSPEYDPTRVLNREDEERLYRHYGLPVYWEADARR
ncbi:MAG TPA: PRC-barrel domain-containing protein [Roseiflexaceae bacterium]|nr:PRC-barrel domain-containing protein [Roseiflexaceae bacterium]